MANEKRGSQAGGRRRRPPTIDLKATEIASEPVKPTEPVETHTETPRAAPEPVAAAAQGEPPPSPPPPSEPPPAAAGPKPGPETGPEPGPATGSRTGFKARGWQPEWLDLAAANARLAAMRSDLAERMNWRLIGAGALGAVAMLALFVALLASGAFHSRDDLTVTLAARLAILELQVRDLASRPLPPGLDQRALADLAARVGSAEQATARLADIESRLARAEQATARMGDLDARIARAEAAAAAPRSAPTDPALAGRVAALEAATRPLADIAARLDAANTAARDAKARADAAFEAAQKNTAAPAAAAADHQAIEALAARVAALEQAAKGAEARIASTVGADRAGRLAFVAVALRSRVERGEPFAPELAAVKPLADAAALAPLEPFAAAGVPRAAALARELSQLTGAMLNAAGAAPRDGGFIDRLQANAERLVRIRPINEAPGDDPATVIARAEVKATHGDLAGARAELESLPPAVRAPAAGWIKRAEAQQAALGAARDLADRAVGALAKP
jgi:hypothetical protein